MFVFLLYFNLLLRFLVVCSLCAIWRLSKLFKLWFFSVKIIVESRILVELWWRFRNVLCRVSILVCILTLMNVICSLYRGGEECLYVSKMKGNSWWVMYNRVKRNQICYSTLTLWDLEGGCARAWGAYFNRYFLQLVLSSSL